MEWQPDNLRILSSKISYKRMRELKGLNSKSEKIIGLSREIKFEEKVKSMI